MSRNAEARIQAEIVAMIRTSIEGCVAYAILNDGLFSKSEAAKRKWMGLLPGSPDVGMVLPNGQAAFLEVKAPGGRLSPEQVQTIARLEDAGSASGRRALGRRGRSSAP